MLWQYPQICPLNVFHYCWVFVIAGWPIVLCYVLRDDIIVTIYGSSRRPTYVCQSNMVLIVGVLQPCNIYGQIRMGTDLSRCTLMMFL